MPAAKSLYPTFPALPAYADPFRTTETAMSLWTEYWRASANAMLWWTDRWMQAPTAWTAWSAAARTIEPRPVAAVIDLAQAAAARMAAEAVEMAEPAAQIVQAVAETPVMVAAEAAEVVEAAVEAFTPEPDDLTRLVGIGPKLAAALAERGVTRFDHIAAWTDKDLGEVDKALDLKGRAVRDAWIAQAKRFAAER